MDLLKALLGNGSVNTFQHTHVANDTAEVVFSLWSAPCPIEGVFFVVRTTQQYKTCVFCVVRAEEL
jgi:hypothetical protein